MIFDTITSNNVQTDTDVSRKNSKPIYTRFISFSLWVLFILNLIFLTVNFDSFPSWSLGSALYFNGFSMLIWTVVTFFGAIVSTYASTYLIGFRYHFRFMILCLAFTVAVMLLVVANHVAVVIASWILMGILMSMLIGIDRRWGEAREASKFTLAYFLAGSLFLALGVLLPSFYVQEFTVRELAASLDEIPFYLVFFSAICIIIAAMIQSAIYPFHRWLVSAMTAPTPASALMHAGFVNGSGILLALFASFLFASHTLDVLFVIGGLTAIIAQFAKLLQVNVKHKLACSTIAQMGFMIMQCGLGFFNAAIAHLILHGFYKAYLFLSSGEEVKQVRPQEPAQLRITILQSIVVLLSGVLGAFLFVQWTGKTTLWDSSIFLTLIVAITVGQVAYNITKERSLSFWQKIWILPVLSVAGIGMYAFVYNGVTTLMSDMPLAVVPTPLSWIQIGFGFVFLLGFFLMKLGVYQKFPRLYVKLMNVSQPYSKTVLMYKSRSV